MKRNFTTLIANIKGVPVQDSEGTISFGRAAVSALLADVQGDSAEEKLARFKLAVRLEAGDQTNFEMSIGEAKLIQDRVQHVCVTLIVGRFDEFLNQG